MECVDRLIDKYKNVRSVLRLSESPVNEYAFVGVGSHSVDNLYPVLDYLRVPLKYICCRSKEKVALIERKYSGVTATTDLEDILSDESVKGVFVSASPSAHFDIASKVLKAGKALFVEKPPCRTSEELDVLAGLAEQSEVPAMAGMQKRHSPLTKALRKALGKDNPETYNLRYVTGRYPEGDPITDLFIHPLDYVTFLFGEAEVIGRDLVRTSGGGVTIMLILRHRAVSGILELSTSSSWNIAEESLTVRSAKGAYEMRQMESLTFSPRPGSLVGIPLEKVFAHPQGRMELFARNAFVPSLVNNQIYTQGYYSEIKTFVDAVEGQRTALISDLRSLDKTYRLMDLLRSV